MEAWVEFGVPRGREGRGVHYWAWVGFGTQVWRWDLQPRETCLKGLGRS